MPNTDESTREKQLHNELKEIASLGITVQLLVALSSLDTVGEPTGLRFKFPERNSKACFIHLDGELMTLMDNTELTYLCREYFKDSDIMKNF